MHGKTSLWVFIEISALPREQAKYAHEESDDYEDDSTNYPKFMFTFVHFNISINFQLIDISAIVLKVSISFSNQPPTPG